METISKLKDVIHHVDVWFVPNTLPDTLPDPKKPYIGKSQALPYLGVEEVAAKAVIYGESINPEEMVRHVKAYHNICAYLAADGYGISNALFRTRIRIPGEYDGYETALPEGLSPAPRINTSPAFQEYIRENVRLDFRGIDETHGHMFTFLDEASGSDSKMTVGGLFHIRGTGLKIVHDDEPEHIDQVGLWFVLASNPAMRLRAASVAINEPRTVVAVIPAALMTVGSEFYLEIVTQSSAKKNGHALKTVRTVRSEHTFQCVNS
ncbi:MAG: DUF4469 domain-containing protein [Tannerella sp.]|jgi:hypothetical protein|nr:DUF4469 domain-containing protein [Tannerella sp.]